MNISLRTSKKTQSGSALASLRAWAKAQHVPFNRLMNQVIKALAPRVEGTKYEDIYPILNVDINLPLQKDGYQFQQIRYLEEKCRYIAKHPHGYWTRRYDDRGEFVRVWINPEEAFRRYIEKG